MDKKSLAEKLKMLVILANKSLVNYNGTVINYEFISLSKVCLGQNKNNIYHDDYDYRLCDLCVISKASKYSTLPTGKTNSVLKLVYTGVLGGSEDLSKVLTLWAICGLINIWDCLENTGPAIINYIDCLDDFGNGVPLQERGSNKYKIWLDDVTSLLLICVRLVSEGVAMEGLCAFDFIYMLEEIYLGTKLSKKLANIDYYPNDKVSEEDLQNPIILSYYYYYNRAKYILGNVPSDWNTSVYDNLEFIKIRLFLNQLQNFADKKLLYVNPENYGVIKKSVNGYYNEAIFLYSVLPGIFDEGELLELSRKANKYLVYQILYIFDINSILNGKYLDGKLYC